MKTIYPPKLKRGDEIRIIAPSSSLGTIKKSVIKSAQQNLEALGFKVTYGKYVSENDSTGSSSVQSRISDLNEAFLDSNVRMVLAIRGGYSANQLLDEIDFQLIRNNPKIFCGYSDITVLSNAIYSQAGLVTYSGPNTASFGMKKGFDYTQEYFSKCVSNNRKMEIKPSKLWSDDAWQKNQEKRSFQKNSGFYPINYGKARGIIVGGNLCSLNLLQGTKYMPRPKSIVLFLEEDDLAGKFTLQETDRNLLSLLQSTKGVVGLVLGRFQKSSQVRKKQIFQMIKNNKKLSRLPVVANADFGHTTPQCTFPIGGEVAMDVKSNVVKIAILKH